MTRALVVTLATAVLSSGFVTESHAAKPSWEEKVYDPSLKPSDTIDGLGICPGDSGAVESGSTAEESGSEKGRASKRMYA